MLNFKKLTAAFTRPPSKTGVDPKQGFKGGRISGTLWKIIMAGFGCVLLFILFVIGGKGTPANTPDDKANTPNSSGSAGGLADILATAPNTAEIMPPQRPNTPNTTSPQGQGAVGVAQTADNGAGNPPQEDPDIRQARQEALRELQRQQQLKEQQFEGALLAPTLVKVDLDKETTSSPDSKEQVYQQALANLQSAQGALTASGQATPNADPNKQDSKLAFTQNAHSNTYLTKGREAPLSTLELKVGTVIPATLISGINSDLPGQVIAQINQNVYDSATHSTILLPQGSKLYGLYDSRLAYGQDRLLMAWTRVNFPDGTTLELQGMGGADAAGYAGFADQVDHHYWKIFGNAFILGIISGATQAGVSDNNSDNISTGEAVNNGVTQQFATAGSSLIQKNLDVQPTITIRNGYKFNVMLNKDVVLPPYQP